jgi:hypothetical protein
MKLKITFVALIAVLIVAFIQWDTDDSFEPVQNKYGDDISAKTQTVDCETGGIGTKNVPFGVMVGHCETSWFVLFNRYAFQVKGQKDKEIKEKTVKAFEPFNSKCDGKECLFIYNDTLIGNTSFEGYYIPRKILWFDEKEYECDYFVVQSGNTDLIQELKDLVRSKNTINTIEGENLMVRLNTHLLSSEEKTLLLASTKETPLTLQVVRNKPLERGLNICEGMIDVIEVK